MTGLSLNPNKSKMLWPQASLPPHDVVQLARTRGIQVSRGMMEVLGAVVGLDTDRMIAWAKNTVNSEAHNRLFASLMHDAMPCQISLRLLRTCALPRLNFLMRVLPPLVLAGALRQFDEKVFRVLTTKIGLPHDLSNFHKWNIYSPIKKGGLGLRSMFFVAPAAFLASIASAAKTIATALGPDRLGQAVLAQTHITHCLAHLAKNGVKIQDVFGAVTASTFLVRAARFPPAAEETN
eukprot:TRINITY_DN1134_c0_g1_i5.p1 TRINITY_DN1134_c0_g1~~TRINITY_DN1134_c0_g1_i5.p1  ORF type:complete len:270 (-),score=35.34 TRINITY_DN1134_c0_g1_i5:1216-1923(-)